MSSIMKFHWIPNLYWNYCTIETDEGKYRDKKITQVEKRSTIDQRRPQTFIKLPIGNEKIYKKPWIEFICNYFGNLTTRIDGLANYNDDVICLNAERKLFGKHTYVYLHEYKERTIPCKLYSLFFFFFLFRCVGGSNQVHFCMDILILILIQNNY